jgi:hypothetical protein
LVDDDQGIMVAFARRRLHVLAPHRFGVAGQGDDTSEAAAGRCLPGEAGETGA